MLIYIEKYTESSSYFKFKYLSTLSFKYLMFIIFKKSNNIVFFLLVGCLIFLSSGVYYAIVMRENLVIFGLLVANLIGAVNSFIRWHFLP